MTATILILPVVVLPATRQPQALRGAPCQRCLGLRFVPFGRMNEAQQRWAPAEAVYPCLDCPGAAQVIRFSPEPA